MSCKRQCNVSEMLHFVVLLNLIFGVSQFVAENDNEDGADLITSLRNDANLDLSVDEEYEDLRAELLAYHTALASLTDKQSRRSLKTTPCWRLDGICIEAKLCPGNFLTQVPGCKNRNHVCCFVWNLYRVKDHKAQGISDLRLPWSIRYPYGGKGVIDIDEKSEEQPILPPMKRETKKNKIKPAKKDPTESEHENSDSENSNNTKGDPIIIIHTM